jgi:hypothetical protein
MKTTHEIKKIEQEAKKLGFSIFAICKRAGINNSTGQRWRAGQTKPLHESWLDFMAAFESLKKEHSESANG